MKTRYALTLALAALLAGSCEVATTSAQEQAPVPVAAPAEQAPEPLTAEETEILVARIALYPDELVAVITAASLYPLQIVEAQRYLDQYAKNKDLKPKSDWDGSVVSLLNYPEIVKMMSDDLDWTQMLGEAITFQQKDVLVAIQQLREKAVAEGIIKTDEKVTVVEENNNIVIQPAQAEVIYVPQYEPQILYDSAYVAAPVTYWPQPYPYYWNPGATFFAGAVTGAVWAAAVDWDDWGVWGGSNWGNDINIDCNKCFNNVDFNGKININDVDWKNVDRSKINIDKNQFTKIDNTKIKNDLRKNDFNNIQNKAVNLDKTRPSTRPAGTGNKGVKDVRTSTLEGLKATDKQRPAGGQGAGNRPAGAGDKQRPAGDKRPAGQGGGQGAGNRPAGADNKLGAAGDRRPAGQGGGNRDKASLDFDKPVGKAKPASRPDNRPKDLSPMGDKGRGKDTQLHSNRGSKAMGGGQRKPSAGGGGGGGHKKVSRGGGGGGGKNRGGGGGRGGRR